MRKIAHIIGFLFIAAFAKAQCDTTGLLLELQATTNLGGIILGTNKCFTSATILSPLYLSGDTLGFLGGSGTVTSFSAGNLAPLFTTLENTPTTTPDLQFTLSNAGANTYFGNSTGGAAAPSYTTAGALTKTDDTNVTLTLGGNPNTSLLRAVSLTLGWSGTLSAARGGTGRATYVIGDLLQANTTTTLATLPAVATGNVLLSGGAGVVSSWGKVGLASHVSGDLPFANITQLSARSVWGVTGNATADGASIQGTSDQVLRVNTAGTSLAFGTVATGGISDAAVTYAKMQTATANNVFLGNNNGAGTGYEELDAAAVQTILGYVDANPVGANGRIAYFTDGNTITGEGAFIYDAANDRQTINCTTPGLGAGAAILNLANVGTDGTGEFLRMSGSIDGNMIAGMYNSNTGATANTLFAISQAGDAAGDAFMQYQISGAGGITHAVGVDNTDNRFKITPNANTPGGTANMGVIVRDNAGVGNTGINNDFPTHPLTVEGRTRSDLFMGEGNVWTAANITFGVGAGTAGTPSISTIVGTGNGFMIVFSTGTTPTAGATVFTATYPTAFITESVPVFSAGGDGADVSGDNAATDLNKFKVSSTAAATFVFEAVGTLPANTSYAFSFNFTGW